jgi:hypothetical protein
MKGKMDLIRVAADVRERAQRDRIRFGGRVAAIERGADTADERTEGWLRRQFERYKDDEEGATAILLELTADLPIIKRMIKIRGVGHNLASQVIALIEDIGRFDTVSKLWRFSGVGVIDGRAERPVKGEKLHYNKRLKVTCWKVAVSLLRAGNEEYRSIYDGEKQRQIERGGEDMTKLWAHKRALRKMIKLWLSHLWEVWREEEGLPVRLPYVLERLGHDSLLEPEEFGW